MEARKRKHWKREGDTEAGMEIGIDTDFVYRITYSFGTYLQLKSLVKDLLCTTVLVTKSESNLARGITLWHEWEWRGRNCSFGMRATSNFAKWATDIWRSLHAYSSSIASLPLCSVVRLWERKTNFSLITWWCVQINKTFFTWPPSSLK